MTSYRSNFLRVLHERGFISQISEPVKLDEQAAGRQITAYIGFDCTAPSLHIGSLVSIMMLYWLQQTGHRPIALMGGGTTRVGDPSGKDESRQLLSDVEIDRNLRSIRKVFGRFLTIEPLKKIEPPKAMESLKTGQLVSKRVMFQLRKITLRSKKLGPRKGRDVDFLTNTTRNVSTRGNLCPAIMENNGRWLNHLYYLDFLRDIGRHFSVNRMLSFDSVKLRLDRHQELSFLEFNYMILQAYDFLELYKRYGCVLQMGGSDQWGNIINGIDLGRRATGAQLFALTSPLITTASGAKMGKTASGAVWLNADRMSPYEYWQYWRNTEDADVGRFLKLFTTLPLDEIARFERLQGEQINEAKRKLATEATALLHGRAAAKRAAETARATFEKRVIVHSLPTRTIPRSSLEVGVGVLTANVEVGFVSSTSEARRQIKSGGLKVNDQMVTDERMILTLQNLTPEGVIKLSLGKKKHVLLKPV